METIDSTLRAALSLLLMLGGSFRGSAVAQNRTAVVGTGTAISVPLEVVPGGIMTIFAAGLSPSSLPASADRVPLPTVLGGISVSIQQSYTKGALAVPLVSVFAVPTCLNATSDSCSTLTGIRLQIPFEVVPNIPGTSAAPNLVRMFITDQAGNSAAVDLGPAPDQIHVLTQGDAKVPPTSSTSAFVTHGDGNLVTGTRPASPGEELVAYAVGLGLTSPAVPTGQAAPSPAAHATEVFAINYIFSPNAAPSRGLVPCASPLPGEPLFVGLSPGSVGLYQLNFVVPSPPSGTPACGGNVYSNLTVTFVGPYSFDSAAICVAVP